MSRQFRISTRPARAALSAVAVAWLAGCATAPPRVTSWSAPPVGATWEVVQRNSGSFGRDARMEVRRGEGTFNGQPAVTFANSLGGTVMARPSDGSWIAIIGADGKPLVSYDPPIGWQYPLEVGKSWKQHYRMTNHANGRSAEFDQTCKVEAFERVTVAAGSFDAFRIGCQNTLGSQETYWHGKDIGLFVKTRLVRPSGSVLGPGTQEAELARVNLKP